MRDAGKAQLERRRLLPRLLLSAALALASSSARAAELFPEDDATCPPDDDEAALLCPRPGDAGVAAPAPAEACLKFDAGPADGGAPSGPETSLGSTRVRVRPTSVRPGDLFEIDVQGQRLRSAAGSFGGEPVTLFATGASSFRGFVAVPLDHAVGPALVHVAVVDEQMVTRSGSATLQLVDRTVIKKTITVSSKFTSPAAAQVAQMKADAKAISASYRIAFGPPLFTGNFVDPLGHERGSRFGERRVFNGRTKSRHWGLDIDGERGEAVHAANDGLVTLARPCFMSGWTVLVSHGAGLFTGYFHFSKFAVKTGDRVKKGEVLGYVGSTGRSTGPHLHFAAKLNDTLVDPEALLDFDFAAAGSAIAAAGGPDAGTGLGASREPAACPAAMDAGAASAANVEAR
ncbi:MAG TPA: M23 family metallopeptidase [Myxococcales bacterium]